MDVVGNNPKNAHGRYFRASVWSWRPIYCLIAEANERFSLGFDLTYYDSNDGAGLSSQRDSNRLADALEAILAETDAPEFAIDESPRGVEAAVLAALGAGGWDVRPAPSLEGVTAVAPIHYSVEREQVEEFITFLRHSGGFEIW